MSRKPASPRVSRCLWAVEAYYSDGRRFYAGIGFFGWHGIPHAALPTGLFATRDHARQAVREKFPPERNYPWPKARVVKVEVTVRVSR